MASAAITQLLQDWQAGDRGALDRLLPLVYDELHVIASRHLAGERPGGTLQTTALVNEAYLKLIDQRRVDWQNRAQFFAIAARLMRRILIDDVRQRRAAKRGHDPAMRDVTDIAVAAPAPAVDLVDLLELDRALQELEQLDPDQARIVELRFFGGMSVEEIGAVIGASPSTVKREWALAKGWLHQALSGRS